MAVIVGGSVKDYAWGLVDGMVPWTGRGTGKPQAELWYGVHPAGPSRTPEGVGADEVLAGHHVPLLLKFLAAARPLSIQIHPDGQQAAAGFAAQQNGIRVYSDPAEKTEMLVAMSEFQALAGWRSANTAARILHGLGYPDPVVTAAERGRWPEAAGLIMQRVPEPGTWDPGRMRRALATDDAREAAALGDIAADYPEDPGVGIAAILRYLRLQPGQAVYMPAGVPHAYLRGVGLEVMTSSDNVLRLGLTNKEIAVEDALRAIRPDRQPMLLLEQGPKQPPGAPFRLTVQRGVDAQLSGGRYRVVLAIDGEVDIAGAQRYELAIGQALLIPAEDPGVHVASKAMVALVEALETGPGHPRAAGPGAGGPA